MVGDSEGCVNIFIGNVRSKNNGRTVKYLDFEVYEKMALLKMEEIAIEAKARWNLNRILIIHRIGKVAEGEIPVIIAVSATHRRPAIQASQYLIDRLKAVVPIWKKEVYDDGEEWVTAHP
jgi:molybdopterin synthase catalytic subunit